MTVDGLEADQPISTAPTRSRGVVDRLLTLVDRFPGPSSVWFVLFAVALVAVATAWIWVTGARPVGQLDPEVIPPALMLAYFLWLIHLLNRIAGSSFDAFRPALGAGASEQDRYRLALTSIPDRVALAAVLVVEVVLNVSYFGTIRPLRPPLPVTVELASAILYALVAASIGLLVVHDIRQLRLVSRLSALAANVDIFKPAPLTALSRLTAATAIGIITFVAVYALTAGITVPTAEQAALPVFIAEEIVMSAFAVASFVLPLRVMHARLVEEKVVLLGAAQDRLKATLGRLHATVEANDMSNADQLNKTISSVLAERDVLLKLPTWPWSTGTFRGVATAVLLPIVIFVITRLIDQLI
ncbi:MAG: hypothetical protein QFC55_01735 [Chloroflexota bacterium]|nr:hypothetical protein [Chloroflexota bacterium]